MSVINKNLEYSNLSFLPSFEHLLMLLRESKFNWFAFVSELEITFTSLTLNALEQMLMDFAH